VENDNVTGTVTGGNFDVPVSVLIFNMSHPTANSTVATTVENGPVIFLLTGTSSSFSPLIFSVVTPPAHGALGSIVPTGDFAAEVTYTPNPGFSGSDFLPLKLMMGYKILLQQRFC